MALKSKTFLVKKGENLDSISSFLYSAIGLDAYLIKGIESTALNETVTQLSVIYQEFPDFVIDSIAPRPGAIIPTGAVGSAFDSRVLFNTPVDPNSFISGVFVIDGVGLATNKFSVRSGTNNYYVKVNLNGYTASGFHELRVDSSKFKKVDGTYFDYSPVAGYTLNSLASSHLGDKLEPYVTRRRGLVKADFIKLSKGVSPQQSIQEYLTQRGLDKEKLVTYTFSSRVDNTIDVFFIYISELEPQILEGYPLTNTLIPNQATLTNLTLVFNTKLDKSQLTTTNGIFSIETDYNTTVPILASDVTVLSDLKTVRLALPSYISADRIYSIVVNVGLKSLQGVVKQKPEQWVLHITEYRGSVGSTTVISGSGASGAAVDAYYVLSRPNASLPNSAVLTGRSGIVVTPEGVVSFSGNLYNSVNSHLLSTSNPHSVTAAQVGSPTISQFTGLTGTVVYSNNAGLQVISGQLASAIAASDPAAFVRLNESQSGDLAGIAYTNVLVGVVTAHTSDFNNPHNTTAAQIGAATTGSYAYLSGLFNIHTGNTGIHFTQSQISIPYTQISNFSVGVTTFAPTVAQFTGHTGDYNNPHNVTAAQLGAATTSSYSYLSGLFNTHTGDTTIHFTQAQISIPSTQISDWTEAVQDVVGSSSFLQFGTGITGTYSDASNTLILSGVYATNSVHGVSRYDNTYFSVANGLVTFIPAGVSLAGLSDVTISSPATSEVLQYNGSKWVNAAGGSGGSLSSLSDVTIVNGAYKFLGYNIDSARWTDFLLTGFGNVNVNQNIATKVLSISGDNSVAVGISGSFTGHTGDNTVHFTQSQISIPYTQISNFSVGVAAFAPTTAQFTGHTGDSTVHFTQAQITGVVRSTGNLADLTNLEASRKTMKLQYIVDDLAFNTSIWTTLSNAGGSAYQYDPQYISFARNNHSMGVMIASNGASTGVTGSAILYHSTPYVSFSTGCSYYFRTAIQNTGLSFVRYGLFNAAPAASTGDPSNAVYFEWDSRSGNTWMCCSVSGGNIIRSSTTYTGVASTWAWTSIEVTTTGYRFYNNDVSSINPIATLTGNSLFNTTAVAARAFTQCRGQGVTFNGIYLDKFAYPMYFDQLPTGLNI